MATKQRREARPRLAELEEQMSEAAERARHMPGGGAVLRMLDDLRKQGVTRAKYNLESAYGHGGSPCAAEAVETEREEA